MYIYTSHYLQNGSAIFEAQIFKKMHKGTIVPILLVSVAKLYRRLRVHMFIKT